MKSYDVFLRVSFHKIDASSEKERKCMNECRLSIYWASSYIAASQANFPFYTDMADAKHSLKDRKRLWLRFGNWKKVRVNTISQISNQELLLAQGIGGFDSLL